MKKNGVWEVVLRIFIAAATAALTALGTTSCMGQGPIGFQHEATLRILMAKGASDQVQGPLLLFFLWGTGTYTQVPVPKNKEKTKK